MLTNIYTLLLKGASIFLREGRMIGSRLKKFFAHIRLYCFALVRLYYNFVSPVPFLAGRQP